MVCRVPPQPSTPLTTKPDGTTLKSRRSTRRSTRETTRSKTKIMRTTPKMKMKSSMRKKIIISTGSAGPLPTRSSAKWGKVCCLGRYLPGAPCQPDSELQHADDFHPEGQERTGQAATGGEHHRWEDQGDAGQGHPEDPKSVRYRDFSQLRWFERSRGK